MSVIFDEMLFDAIEKSDVKMTFGLQPHHIQKIETELKRWNDMPPVGDKDDAPYQADPRFMKYVWEKLGVELGWCPFTLALNYFEYLEDSK